MSELLLIFVLVKVFGNLNLDIAEVAFSRDSFPLLLLRICRLLCARRSTFQATVPVV
jgi:hypothetical protein